MRKTDNGHGYLHVKLYKNGLSFTAKVHREVAIAFIPNPNNLPQVNHKDCVKTNNRSNNLEWSTNQDNVIHAFTNNLSTGQGMTHRSAKFTEDDVKFIRAQKGLTSVVDLCNKYKVSSRAILDIWRGETWKSLK